MKVINFKESGANGSPFSWKPWGFWGWLWRLLAFLLLLFLLLFILSFIKGCEHGRTDIPEEILQPTDSMTTPRVPIDTANNVRTDIDDPGPYLPDPEDNHFQPIDDDEIITDDQGAQLIGDRLNVLLDDPNAGDETFRQWSKEFKQLYPGDAYQVLYYDPLTKLMQIGVPAAEREAIMERLPQQITDISFKVFDESIMSEMASRPNDPGFRYEQISWYLAPIQAYDAWAITQGSENVTVAIVDSYFDLNHDELNSNRITKPFSVMRRTGNVAPDAGLSPEDVTFYHGSMVASQAIGTINNNRGLCGIAPKCKFMPISLGHQFTSLTIMQGMLYAIYQGADVVNLSCGLSLNGTPIQQLPVEQQIAISKQYNTRGEAVWDFAFKLAAERNVTIVWAAGNDHVLTGLDPSKRNATTVVVSAVDHDLKSCDFSNFGNFPSAGIEQSTISAPGNDIFGAMPYNSYNVGPGTSFAAPIVTGAVALMKSLNPNLTNKQIVKILKETGRPIEGDNTIGPLLQIKSALLRAKATASRTGRTASR